jgi:hypothetical protein
VQQEIICFEPQTISQKAVAHLPRKKKSMRGIYSEYLTTAWKYLSEFLLLS